MKDQTTRAHKKALAEIKRNIDKTGYHVYLVSAHDTPRFAYTIGLRDTFGAELILPGALFYDGEEVLEVLRSIREHLSKGVKGKLGATWHSQFRVGQLGTFTLRKAHHSWTRSLMLGALDYYSIEDIDAYQIVPDDDHRTIDVPNMAKEWSATLEPVWQWLHDDWQHPVPSASEAMPDMAALRGAPVTEACRWEDNYWEMFTGSGEDVPKDEVRLVPLGCLVAVDPSLLPVTKLAVGEGMLRDEGGTWRRWVRKTAGD